MFSLFRPLTKYLKVKPVRIYDAIFILHSKLTVTILLACSFLISAKQFFGDPIYCKCSETNSDLVNNFCWTMGTYIYEYSEYKIIGREIISWGIPPDNIRNAHIRGPRIYLRYYQWVVLVLLLQALVFLLPSKIWRNWEGGRLQQLCDELSSAVVDNEVYLHKKKMLLDYFTSDYKDIHICYAIKYIFCEVLNFVICILNISMMNVFLTGFWENYASVISVMRQYDWDIWNYYTSRLFPKLAKCDFYIGGPSGGILKLDALCVLPLNILNEKIFAFLWVWFVILTVISGLNLIYRIFIICSVRFRLQLIRAHMRFMTTADVRRALNRCNFGDWFILYKIGNNINPIVYRNLIEDLIDFQKTRNEKSTI